MKRSCVAGILLNTNGEVLLLHRKADRKEAANCWSVVSGHIEQGESPLEAVRREIAEELNIQVAEPTVTGLVLKVEDQNFYPFLFFIDKKLTEYISLNPNEHDQMQWIAPQDLPNFQTVSGLWSDLQLVQLRPQRLIIGVVGKNGSGKDTVVDRLVYQHGFVKIHLSDFVKEEAVRKNIQLTRKNLNMLSQQILVREGAEALSQRAVQLIEKHNWTKVAICGIRTPANVDSFERFYNQGEVSGQLAAFQLWAIQIHSDKERFARMLVRSSSRDPQTWQEFQEQEEREERLFHIAQTENLAAVKLSNDGALDQLHHQIDLQLSSNRC